MLHDLPQIIMAAGIVFWMLVIPLKGWQFDEEKRNGKKDDAPTAASSVKTTIAFWLFGMLVAADLWFGGFWSGIHF